jgi:hypothetical protein
MSEYTCEICFEIYQKMNNEEWNDYKASEEVLALYPETKNDPMDIICDDCNKKFVKWFSTLTKEQKREMREQYK